MSTIPARDPSSLASSATSDPRTPSAGGEWRDMRFLRNLSIKRKLMLIAMVTSSLALLVASVGFLAYDLTAFRARMSHDLMTQAEIVGANSMAALAFQDKKATREILAALEAKDEIVAAAIYAPDGTVFTDYQRDAAHAVSLPPGPRPDGSFSDGRAMRVFYAIVLHDQTLGTLYIESDLRQERERLVRYTGLVAVLMCGAAFVALLLSSRLQRVISEPILTLERTMRTVSSQKNFGLRVARTQHDEIGALIDGFNTMLFEIQQRDAALQSANDALQTRTQQLEQQIAERLRVQEELKTLNTTLEQRVAERSAAAEQRAEEVARSRNALEKQTRILQSILDSMSEGVIVADDAGRLIVCNPAAERVLRVTASESLSGNWVESHGFYRPDKVTPYPRHQFPLMLAMCGEAVEAAQVFVIDRQRPEGIWLSVDAKPLTGEDGVVHNGVAIFRNITASKRAEEELLRAKDAAEAASLSKSQFLANMSHELRTPLNAIIGYSEILQDQARESGQDDAIADLEKIHAAGRHLQSLIDHILDLSKIEAGKMELLLETFDVAQLVGEVTTTLQKLVEQNGNTLQVHCGAEVGYMRADMTKVRQVLFNLLSNAGKFTENGAVRVETMRVSDGGRDRICIAVHDTGIGMTEAQIARLFEDFTQVDASTTRKYGGTGLGLAISRRFCEMMGGSIDVDSELGRGSTFRIELPAKVELGAEPPVLDELTDDPAIPAGAASGNLVLVIDDDPIAQDVVARLLIKEGFEVVTASSGAEGLQLARQLRPSVITLDVIMPGMDGWAVLSAIKCSAELSDIPVVMVTMTDDRRTGYLLGAAEYLTKPIDPGRLSAIVTRNASPGGTVLVVDDEPAARELTGRQLRKAGWEVIEAVDGRSALQHIAQHTPNLIILDLMMPEMDGFEVIASLRAHAEWHTIPVVVVTAKEVTEEDQRRLNGSVGQVLEKAALRREELLASVRRQVRACMRSRTAV
jgi:PAS domain S-box-containing protein